jgi:hypothetical protein
VVEDNAETIHVYSKGGCMFEADKLGCHVDWGASLQQTLTSNLGVLLENDICSRTFPKILGMKSKVSRKVTSSNQQVCGVLL